MLLGERNVALQGSGLASVHNNDNYYYNDNNGSYSSRISNNATRNDGRAQAVGHYGQLTPPADFPIADETMMGGRGFGAPGGVLGWLEIWDYAGGSSFRGFVAEDAGRETKSLFVFFDAHAITRDLKQAYVLSLLSLFVVPVDMLTYLTDSSLSLSSPRGRLLARTWSSASSGRYPRRKRRD
jgi:hypothetical protein